MDLLGSGGRLLGLDDDGFQGIEIKRFREVVIGPEFHGFHGVFHGRFGGYDDHQHFGALFLEVTQQFQPGNVGHLYVEDGKVVLAAIKESPGFLSVCGQVYSETLLG